MQLEDYEAAYVNMAEDPVRWMSSARNLLAASSALWLSIEADLQGQPAPDGGHHADVAQDHGRGGSTFLKHAAAYLMLAGFAVENALKALRVKQEGRAVVAPRRGTFGISKVVDGHDLQKLATQAGLSLSTSEAALLDRLKAYLVWAGRYPVAASASGQVTVQVIWGSDHAAVTAFIGRVEACL